MQHKKILAALFLLVFTCSLAAPFSVSAATATTVYSVDYNGYMNYTLDGVAKRVQAPVTSHNGKFAPDVLTGVDYTFELAEEIEFKRGLYYTIDYNSYISKTHVDTAAPGVVASYRLSLGNADGYYISDVHIFADSGRLYIPAVTFLCTEDFTVDRIYFYCSYDEDNLTSICYYGPAFTYSIMSPAEYESALWQGMIENQTNQILSGSNLTAPPGINDSEIGNRFDQFEADENDVGTALGGWDDAQNQLNDIMQLPSFGSDFTAAFAKINTVFTRVVGTLDLSVALTFMLVFGLALFVIGRRVR